MRIKPVITEKSMNEAKEGNYTFFVAPALNKFEIKKIIEDLYKVSVVKVRTVNKPRMVKKTYTGRYKVIPAVKKAVVTLNAKDKIDLFEEKKVKKSKK